MIIFYLITFLLSVYRISSQRLTELAEQIFKTFNESARVYYTPFVKTDKKSVNALGKLWERYKTEKKEFQKLWNFNIS